MRAMTRLIDATLQKINQGYIPGTLREIKKNHPEKWATLLQLETEINRAAWDQRGPMMALDAYKAFLREMGRFARAQRREGNI